MATSCDAVRLFMHWLSNASRWGSVEQPLYISVNLLLKDLWKDLRRDFAMGAAL